MDTHAVVVVGGGPTGLMLAAELALAGTDAVVVERRTDQTVVGTRARGLLPRSIEVLDQRGVADRVLEAGYTVDSHGFGSVRFRVDDLPTRHPYVLALTQGPFESLLADWASELGVRVLRGRDAVHLGQDEAGVDVDLSDGTRLRADWLVGCDGGRSTVRREAGIAFPGHAPTRSWMLAEVELAEEPPLGMVTDDAGTHGIGPGEAEGCHGLVVMERSLGTDDAPDVDELRAALVGVWGSDLGLRRVRWATRFTDGARQAATYRSGRVLLAGDAAHVHPPMGGQGMNTGLQDAVNLGWKLALVVAGRAPDSLLDSYHDERHPVGARVVHNTLAQAAMTTPGARHDALRDTLTELLSMDEPRHHVASMLCALDVAHEAGDHPLVGRRMPDLDLVTADGGTRVHELLHAARPVLLHLEGASVDVAGWQERVDVVSATAPAGAWRLPVVGEVTPVPAVLVRPDGHVAWAGDPTDAVSLRASLTRWFGPPTPA